MRPWIFPKNKDRYVYCLGVFLPDVRLVGRFDIAAACSEQPSVAFFELEELRCSLLKCIGMSVQYKYNTIQYGLSQTYAKWTYKRARPSGDLPST